MKIKQVKKFDGEVYDSIVSLLPQLTTNSKPPTKEYFKKLLKSKNIYLFVAKVDKKVVGTLILASCNILVGTKYWIEDVVIDESQRGKGYGKELTQFAIDFAKSLGAKSVNLTSQPYRIEANGLYPRLGFVKIETNVYRYNF